MKQRILYGVEDSCYLDRSSSIVYLSFDKDDANRSARLAADVDSDDELEDNEESNNVRDLYHSRFSHRYDESVSIVQTLAFDLNDPIRYPVYNDYESYNLLHTDENRISPVMISIDNHLKEASKGVLRDFLGKNNIIIDKSNNFVVSKLDKKDLIMAVIDLMKYESKESIIIKLQAAQNKRIEGVDKVSKTKRGTAKCSLTDEYFIHGELRVCFDVYNRRDQETMATKWCKFDTFFNYSIEELHKLIIKKKLCKEKIRIIVPNSIQGLKFDDLPAIESLSESEVEKVNQALVLFHKNNTIDVNIKRSYEDNDDKENLTMKKICV